MWPPFVGLRRALSPVTLHGFNRSTNPGRGTGHHDGMTAHSSTNLNLQMASFLSSQLHARVLRKQIRNCQWVELSRSGPAQSHRQPAIILFLLSLVLCPHSSQLISHCSSYSSETSSLALRTGPTVRTRSMLTDHLSLTFSTAVSWMRHHS